MNKIFLFIAIFCAIILQISCNAKPPKQYANELKECIEPEHIKILNRLCKNFDKHITTRYRTDLPQAYKQYLAEAYSMKLSKDFFSNPAFHKDIELLKSSGFFDQSRAKLSEVEKTSGSDTIEEIPIAGTPESSAESEIREEMESNLTTYDPKGNYIKCLSSKNDNDVIESYIGRLNDGMIIIPSLSAGALQSSLTDQDYENSLVRLFIAMNVHYEMMIMLIEEKRQT